MDKLHNLTPQAINYGSAASGSVTTPENPRSVPKRAETEITAAPADVAGLTIEQAAAELGLPPTTVRYWIDRRGCPTVRRGGRGRGNATLIDPAAVRAWMAGRDQPATTAPTSEHGMALMYAERVPDLLAEALYNAWRETDGPAKRQLAASVAVAWYQAASAELDRLRNRHPDIPHVTSLPEAIVKLKLIV